MNSDSHEQLSLETLRRVDAVCAAYEKAWSKDQPPRLEDFLEGIDEPERGLVFRELLKLDAELRGRSGLLPQTEELRQRFPEYGELLTALDSKNIASDVTVPPRDSSPHAPREAGHPHAEREGYTGETTDGTQPHPSDIDDLPFLGPPTKAGAIGKLGHYDIEGVVGRGGMGVVLRAFDSKLNRIVAIKVLGPQFATNATARRRFEREAKAAAAVSHDHVVAIHHVDEIGGVPFLVMPLIFGQSLQDRLDQSGPLGLKEILRIGHQIAEGLAAAHKQGLVHRDIKPANILLENGVERVKITDFGLARAVDDASVTQSGVVAGTPMFMAPEQAANETVDHRADLFSLGSVLYTMCTGRPPFRATGTIAVMMRVIEDTPRPIREINPDIPDWLCDIISKLHAKKPAERFQTAKEVAELLEQHLAHLQQPELAPKPAAMAGPVKQHPSTKPVRVFQAVLAAAGVGLTLAAFAVPCVNPAKFPVAIILLLLGFAALVASAIIRKRWDLVWALFTITAAYGLIVGALFIPISGYSDMGWWSTPWIELGAAGGFALLALWQFVRKSRPGWLPALSVLLAIFFIALGHALWPFSTARHFACLVREGRYEEANRLLRQPTRFEVKDGFVILHTEKGDAKITKDETLLIRGGDWDNYDAHVQRSGYGEEFPFDMDSINMKNWQNNIRTDHKIWLHWRAHNGRVRFDSVTFWDQRTPRDPKVITLAEWNELKELELAGLSPDAGRLQGTWVAVVGDINGGQRVPVELLQQMTLTFTGNKARVTNPDGKAQEGTFTLDETQSPKHITVKEETPKGIVTMKGIYSLEGDTLKLCMGGPEDPRPTQFASQAGSRIMNLVLKKAGAVITPKLPETAAEVLAAMVGAWRVEITHKIIQGQPAKLVTQGYADIGWVAGKRWLRVREQVGPPGANFVQIFSYDPATSDFRNFHFDATGLVGGPTTSRWDSRTHTLTGTSRPDESGLMVKNTRFLDANTMEWEAIVRDKTGKTLFDTTAKLTRSPQPAKINEDEAPLPVPAEMAVLHKQVGDWQTEGVMKLPAQAPVRGKSTTARVMGGRFLETRITDSQLQREAYGLSTYDPAAKSYRIWAFDGHGGIHESTGAWEAQAQKMTLTWAEPNLGKGNTTQQWRGPDRHDETIIAWDAGGKVVTEVQSTTTRQPDKALGEMAAFLARQVGSWQVESEELRPVPRKINGFTINTMVAGGKALRSHTGYVNAPYENLSMTWIDPETKKMRSCLLDSRGESQIDFDQPVTESRDAAMQTGSSIVREADGDETQYYMKFEGLDKIVTGLIRRNPQGVIVRETRNVMTRWAAGEHPQPISPNRPEAAKMLEAFQGDWQKEMTVKKGAAPGQPKTTTINFEVRPILAGFFFEGHEDNPDLPGKRDYWIMGGHGQSKNLRFFHWSAKGGAGRSEGSFDKTGNMLRWTQAKTASEWTWTVRSPNQFDIDFAARDTQGKLVYEATGIAKRKGSAAINDPNAPENVLARMFGTWNIIQQRQIPTPETPEQARSAGVFVFEPVAGGKFWRGLGSFDDAKSNNQQVLVVRTYDQTAKEFKEWWFTSDGINVGAGTGTWDAATQSFTWRGSSAPGVEGTNTFKFLGADTIQGHLVRKENGKIVFDARNTMNRVHQTLAPPALPLDPKRPAALQALDALSGFWRNDFIMKRVPEPEKPYRLITDHHIRPILAGHFFEAHDDDGDLQAERNYWLIGSAAGGKHYRFWHFNIAGGHIVSNGAWDETQKKIRWIATDGSTDASWTMKSSSERAFELVANDSLGKFLFHAKGNSRRLETPTLKSFKPEHQLLTTDGVRPDQGGWRIDSKDKGIVRLFELQYPGVDDCKIVMKAKLKTQKMEGGASLEMWARLVDQEFFSKGEGEHQVAGTTNWSDYEIPFFLKKGQLVNRLQLGLRLGGAGTVWIKDIVLERR